MTEEDKKGLSDKVVDSLSEEEETLLAEKQEKPRWKGLAKWVLIVYVVIEIGVFLTSDFEYPLPLLHSLGTIWALALIYSFKRLGVLLFVGIKASIIMASFIILLVSGDEQLSKSAFTEMGIQAMNLVIIFGVAYSRWEDMAPVFGRTSDKTLEERVDTECWEWIEKTFSGLTAKEIEQRMHELFDWEDPHDLAAVVHDELGSDAILSEETARWLGYEVTTSAYEGADEPWYIGRVGDPCARGLYYPSKAAALRHLTRLHRRGDV